MKSAVFQAFLTVLGVVLAFGANEWREWTARNERAAQALAGIYREMETNRDAVAEARRYNGEKLALVAERRKAGAPLAVGDFPRGFVRYAELSDAAFISAEQTGVFAEMPYETVLEISRVYAQQQRYRKQAEIGAGIIYEALFEDGYGAIVAGDARVETLIGSAWYLEGELEKTLASTLAARSSNH